MFHSSSSRSRCVGRAIGLGAWLVCAPGVVAQLANPSFETLGGATSFDSWREVGNVAVATDLPADGARCAKTWGPFIGQWAVGGVYQDLPAAPGQVFTASVYAGYPSSDPIVGLARAILNIEWRDASGVLISYESVDLVTAADPADAMNLYTHTSGLAPPNTATARLLLGILQSPANETGSVRFDLASFARDTVAEHEVIQWTDFGDRTIQFAGYTWRCKDAASPLGPGPNWFSQSPNNAWVDAEGRLHLRITYDGSHWVCPEITLEEALGHGDYVFVTEGRVDQLDPNIVLGMFLWEYQESYDGSGTTNVANEFDIELSRWGDPNNTLNDQFVAQPWSTPGNLSRYTLTLSSPDDITTHAYLWRDGQVVCRTWLGDAPEPTSGTLVHEFDYRGPDVPRDEAPRVHLNFWLMYGLAPLDGQEHEVVIDDFRFVPPPVCNADLDADADTDVFDFGIFAGNFGAQVPALTGGDFDGDSDVDVFDFGTLAADFGCTSP